MFTKFETKSSRVKGLAFHPRRPWILASLHNGHIQLWDFQDKALIHRFEGHQGPVRGLDFHRTQPLFVSGGDDCKIKLWNYSSKQCIYTFPDKSHDDFIRTTYFHPKHPWIISSSDDGSVRIWNWQSRTRIAVLTGHIHYVMCAQVHPTKDLILSASIDQTLRLWDISTLASKSSSSMSTRQDEVNTGLPEILAKTDYAVESKDAHLSEINWCAFHPNQSNSSTKDLALSGADDNMIKVWEVSRFGLKELYSLRGHYDNINCAVFHPRKEIIISASNDRSLRIWDMNSRRPLSTHRRDVDRFWVVAAHPNQNLFAAGHDTGLMVFKIEKERPDYFILRDEIVYTNKNQQLKYNMKTGNIVEQEKKIQPLAKPDKKVVTCENKKLVARISDNKIAITDNKQTALCTIKEPRKIKSAVWDNDGVLVYSTAYHIKYALTDGHCHTLFSPQEVLYIVAIRDNILYCMDRKSGIKQVQFDPREFKFKLAVISKDRAKILSSIKQLGGVLSRAEISFLVQKGYPDLALKFVQDHSIRFSLALHAFDIDDALQSAVKINQKKCWEQLAEAAWQIGHVKAVERAHKELKNSYKLAMLYLVCGQSKKMPEARQMAKDSGNISEEFLISLLMKDSKECAKIMLRCGHPNLAYACAVNHGNYELAMEISQELTDEQLARLPPLENALTNKSKTMAVDSDVQDLPFENWPLLGDEQESFDAILAEPDADMGSEKGEWNDDSEEESEPAEEKLEDVEEDGWGDDDDVEELDDNEEPEEMAEVVESSPVVEAAESITARWSKRSDLALHHVLAGSYKSAFRLLQNQVGASNPEPLKEIFEDLFLQSRAAYQGLAIFPTTYIYPTSEADDSELMVPSGGYQLDELEARLNECYQMFSKGKHFETIILKFRSLLLSTLFLQIYSSESRLGIDEQIARTREIIQICKEYILGLQVYLQKESISPDSGFEGKKRACELMAYFSKLNMAKHKGIVLAQAMKVFDKTHEDLLKTQAACSIARRFLGHPSSESKPKLRDKAEKIEKLYDIQVDQRVGLDFEDKISYSLCAESFKPMTQINQIIGCPFCAAKYNSKYEGKICNICTLSEVGRETSGVKFEVTNFQ